MVHLAHINARSVCNKYLEMQEYIVNNGIDLCAVMETWIKSDDFVTPREVVLMATMF